MSEGKTIYADDLKPVLDAYGEFKRYEPLATAIAQKIDELPPAVAMLAIHSAHWEPDPAAGWLCSRCEKWHVAREAYCCSCGANMADEEKAIGAEEV